MKAPNAEKIAAVFLLGAGLFSLMSLVHPWYDPDNDGTMPIQPISRNVSLRQQPSIARNIGSILSTWW